MSKYPALISTEALVGYVRLIFQPSLRPWCLFKHGTVVGPLGATADLAEAARAAMRRHGLVRPGSAAADFLVRYSAEEPPRWPGWIVLGPDHRMIATYVGHEELPPGSTDVVVGLFGRSKRNLDAERLEVVHVEAGGETPPSG